MNRELTKKLRLLNRIVPDPDYRARSRMLLLAAPFSPHRTTTHATRFHIRALFRLATALGLGLVGILAIVTGTNYVNETYSPLALEGLNQRNLTAEANEINNSIEVTLSTIDYIDTSSQSTSAKIAAATKPEATTFSAAAATAMPTTTPATATSSIDTFLIKDTSTQSSSHTIDTILDAVAR